MGKVVKLDSYVTQIYHTWNIMTESTQPYFTVSGNVLLQDARHSIFIADGSVCVNLVIDLSPADMPSLLMVLNKMSNTYIYSLPVAVVNNVELLQSLLPACYLLACGHQYASVGKPLI